METLRSHPFATVLLLFSTTWIGPQCLGVTNDFIADKTALRRKYAYLTRETVKTISATEKQFHRARLIKFQGLHVLSLDGDEYEMAYQHGRLLRDEIRNGVPIAASEMIHDALDVSLAHRPLIAQLARGYVERNFNDPILESAVRLYPTVSQSALRQIFALSEATQIPTTTLIDGALNPSVLMMLANGMKADSENVAVSPANGCSSFAVWGDYTADGELLVGRNTDYPLNGAFEKYATVIYFHPTQGQRYMAAITAGVHSASVLALNESGIFLATHSLPSYFTGTEGLSPILWMNDVIARATTVDEAVAILTSRRTNVGWTYFVASEKERRALSVEVDNKGFGIRESTNGKHVQTNHYLSPQMKNHTLFFNGGTQDETFGRFNRVNQLIESNKGQLGVRTAVSILGDSFDTHTGEWNGYPSAVAAVTTATSIVYRPKTREVYVASGVTPVSKHSFIKLPLPQDFNSNTFTSYPVQTMRDDTFATAYPNRMQSLDAIIGAKIAFEDKQDVQTALNLVSRARTLAPEVAHYSLVEGLFFIRTGQFASAAKALQRAQGGKLSNTGTLVSDYYLGRLYAHAGNSKLAESHLYRVASSMTANAKLQSAASDALQTVRRRGSLLLQWHDVIPQIQFSDSQKY